MYGRIITVGGWEGGATVPGRSLTSKAAQLSFPLTCNGLV
jgi:hypothetical protein